MSPGLLIVSATGASAAIHVCSENGLNPVRANSGRPMRAAALSRGKAQPPLYPARVCRPAAATSVRAVNWDGGQHWQPVSSARQHEFHQKRLPAVHLHARAVFGGGLFQTGCGRSVSGAERLRWRKAAGRAWACRTTAVPRDLTLAGDGSPSGAWPVRAPVSDGFRSSRRFAGDPKLPVGPLQSCPTLWPAKSLFASTKRPFVATSTRPQADDRLFAK